MEKTMYNLERNNMKPYFVREKGEVVPLISRLIQAGDTVSAGGSESLFQTGVIDFLSEGPYYFLNRYEEGLTEQEIRDIYLASMGADAYFCSSNAVTEAGELYNVDGNANRVSAIAYGPRSVIMVVGRNKLVADIDEAVRRVKTVVAPEICRRRGRDTFCGQTGRCAAEDMGIGGMAAGCGSPDRTCCTCLVTGRQRVKDRIKVILVDEELGI